MATHSYVNAIVNYLRSKGVPAAEVFAEAQHLLRWHYQWIVVHEFLPLTVGEALMDDILTNGFNLPLLPPAAS